MLKHHYNVCICLLYEIKFTKQEEEKKHGKKLSGVKMTDVSLSVIKIMFRYKC